MCFIILSSVVLLAKRELEEKRAELEAANGKLRTLNDTRKMLTAAEISHARSSAKYDAARENVASCQERLTAALAEESRARAETCKLFHVAERMRRSWLDDHKIAANDDKLSYSAGSGEDVHDNIHEEHDGGGVHTVKFGARVVAVDIGGDLNGKSQDSSVSDERGKAAPFVSVLARSPYTPNSPGPYTSPLSALRQYVYTA
jgi:hypothetical protein